MQKLLHHSSGGTQKKEGAVLPYIPPPSGEAQDQGVGNVALLCSAGMLGTDVWLEPSLTTEWKVCGLMPHCKSYDGGFMAAVPYRVLSLRTGVGIQTLLLEGCALPRDPW